MKRTILATSGVLVACALAWTAVRAQQSGEPPKCTPTPMPEAYAFTVSTDEEWRAEARKVREKGLRFPGNCKPAGDRLYCVAEAEEYGEDEGK